MSVISYYYGKYLKKTTTGLLKVYTEGNVIAGEALFAIRTVKSFGNERYESLKYSSKAHDWFGQSIRQRVWELTHHTICNCLVSTINRVSTLVYGIYLVFNKGMSPTVLIAFIIYQEQLQRCITWILDVFSHLMKSSASTVKVFEYLDRKPEKSFGALKPVVKGHVEFNDVYFSYPVYPEKVVLKGLSFSVKPNELVALVGSSGSGKSTCFHLLENFYEPTTGKVSIDGFLVQDIEKEWLHRHIGIVCQEPTLMSGNVLQNIIYPAVKDLITKNDLEIGLEPPVSIEWDTCPEVLRKRVVEVAKIANAHKFICSLLKGYNTQVGEQGGILSGGQKQRVAIARALILDPPILLLDEATSALDTKAERVVQEALENAMKGRTTLVIAHRLSTVVRANRILVFHDGRVVQSGTHEELLLQDHAGFTDYKQMVARQKI